MSLLATKVGLVYPPVGAFCLGAGNFFLAEGRWDLGSGFTILGMNISHLGSLAHKGSLCHDVVKTSAIQSTFGIAMRGLWNCCSGIRNQDLSKIRRGTLQFVASAASYQLVSNLPAPVLSAINTSTASGFLLFEGIKRVAAGEINMGATIAVTGLVFMIHSGLALFR